MNHQMTNKNTVTIVTPPDFHINAIGPIVLLLGVDLTGSKPYTSVYERLFPEVEINFFVGEEGFKPEHIAWYRAAAGIANSVFINIEGATTEEILIATQIEQHNKDVMVYWISESGKSESVITLLNSYSTRIFTSLNEIETFLVDEFKNS